MRKRSVFLRSHHTLAYRRGHKAKIVGFEWITPDGHPERVCYKVRYSDGVIDYIPVTDSYYEIVKEEPNESDFTEFSFDYK